MYLLRLGYLLELGILSMFFYKSSFYRPSDFYSNKNVINISKTNLWTFDYNINSASGINNIVKNYNVLFYLKIYCNTVKV